MSLTTLAIGGSTYTSYASEAEADAYLAVDPIRCDAWMAVPPSRRAGYLVAATRRLDLLQWAGKRVDAEQLTEWPRTGATDAGVAVDSADVPQSVEDACILLAGSIAMDPAAAGAGTSGSNIRSVGAGSTKVEFFRRTRGVSLQDETAFALVAGLLAGAGSGASLYGGATGTDGVSSFEHLGSPGIGKGFA